MIFRVSGGHPGQGAEGRGSADGELGRVPTGEGGHGRGGVAGGDSGRREPRKGTGSCGSLGGTVSLEVRGWEKHSQRIKRADSGEIGIRDRERQERGCPGRGR